MSFSQVAKLHLRGSLVTQTLRNLTPEQQEELNNITKEIVADPALTPCRTEFRNALARTISFEYNDRDVGDAEFQIAVMRAALAAKYGWGDKKPTRLALTDPHQRKKWVQTWVFNYLRQILRENKLAIVKDTRTVKVHADNAAMYEIHQALQSSLDDIHDHHYKRYVKELINNMQIRETATGYVLQICLWSFPTSLESKLKKLAKEYHKHDVLVSFTGEEISITWEKEELPLIPIQKTEFTQLRSKSFDATDRDDNSQRSSLESSALKHSLAKKEPRQMEESETLQALRERVPTDVLPVLDIYDEEKRPEEFVKRYGERNPRIAHVAEFLGKSPREVKRSLATLQHHCLALGVGK